MALGLRRPALPLSAGRFVGACYVFKLVDSALVFRVLYGVLNWGHALPRAHVRGGGGTSPLIGGLF